MITVFYDGQCGLCRKEIDYYKRIAAEGIFTWLDITKDASEFEALGFSLAEGLRILHVKDSQDVIYKGVDAFILLWKFLPGWKILAFFVGLPLIHPLVAAIYNCFAAWRYKRMGYPACNLP